MSVNTFIGSGNLTRDAESRFTAAGKELCYFTIAVNTRKDEEPLFVRVTAWERLAQQCSGLKKGAAILVQGALRMSKWKGSDDKDRQSLEMTASSVEFLDRGEERPAEAPESGAARWRPTFRTTRIPAAGTDSQGTLSKAGGMPPEEEADPF